MKPLSGVRVLDFSQLHGAVYATMLLADFGAEVIKVERPGRGDMLRSCGPQKNGYSVYHAYLNRGKKSIAVDLSRPEGRQAVKKLAAEVDVVCENFRSGTMEKLGMDYEKLKKIKPEIIYATLTGYGRSGLLADRTCLENTAQAHSSMLDMSGEKNGPPITMGAPLGSLYGGLHLATAINMALIHREKTGEGQQIDVSCVDSLLSALEDGLINCSLVGHKHERNGNQSIAIAPYDTFQTKDGFVSIGVSTERQWEKFCAVMGLEDLVDSPDYNTNGKRGLNYHKGLRERIEAVTREMSKFQVEELLSGVNIPGAAVCTITEAIDSEQARAREMVAEVADESLGRVRMPGVPAKLYQNPGDVSHGARPLGADTAACLAELGYSPQEIAALAERGIVDGPEPGNCRKGDV